MIISNPIGARKDYMSTKYKNKSSGHYNKNAISEITVPSKKQESYILPV